MHRFKYTNLKCNMYKDAVPLQVLSPVKFGKKKNENQRSRCSDVQRLKRWQFMRFQKYFLTCE